MGSRGQTFAAFNETDFSKSLLLFSKASSAVTKLAWAVAKEVRQKGLVAVHAFSDDKEAVNTALKALATVPKLTAGERVTCVPSFGRAGEERRPTLRIAVRRLPRA